MIFRKVYGREGEHMGGVRGFRMRQGTGTTTMSGPLHARTGVLCASLAPTWLLTNLNRLLAVVDCAGDRTEGDAGAVFVDAAFPLSPRKKPKGERQGAGDVD